MEQQGTAGHEILQEKCNNKPTIKGFVAEIPGKVEYENGHGINRQY